GDCREGAPRVYRGSALVLRGCRNSRPLRRWAVGIRDRCGSRNRSGAYRPRNPGPVKGGWVNPAHEAGRLNFGYEERHGILESFYATLGTDTLLASYFEEIDMSAHIPRIVTFWSTILFGTHTYSGNAFAPHQGMPGLTGRHFGRWVETMEATIDARFSGP